MPGGQGIVIDTSVAIKWIIDEEGSDEALALQSTDMVAPALFRIEAGNVLRTMSVRNQISGAQAQELFVFLQSAPVVLVDHDEALERRALQLALALQHPIYDCVYLALAERMNRQLVTADRRFVRALSEAEYRDRAVDVASVAGGRTR